MCAVGLVIGVAYDGDVSWRLFKFVVIMIIFIILTNEQVRIWEAISFLLFYIIYIVVVVTIGYIRVSSSIDIIDYVNGIGNRSREP